MRYSKALLALALLASSGALAQAPQINDVQLRPGSSSLWGSAFNVTNNQDISQYNTAGSVLYSFRWFQGASTGSAAHLYSISPTGAIFGAATGGLMGAGTINATGFYQNGVIFGGTPGGTNGQIQFNNSGLFGGFTTSGDATINTASGALTLATVNANVGSFGSATACTAFTVNAKGLLTAASAATCTPAIASVSGLGTGIATALAINVGSAGAPVLFNGALGTPSSGTGTNLTGIPFTGLTGDATLAQLPQGAANSIWINPTGSLADMQNVAVPACANDGTHALVYINATGLQCATITAGSGTVTSVTAGGGLASTTNPIVATGTLSLRQETVSLKTTGTAQTYTSAATSKYVRAQGCGGAGGGGGSGTSGTATAGTTGTATTLTDGVTTWTGAAGGPGTAGGAGGAGGTGTNGDMNLTATAGQGAFTGIAGNFMAQTGGGHSGLFGLNGGNGGQFNGAGSTGAAGGGAGCFLKILPGAGAAYTYTIGLGGAGGAAGTSGQAGVAGRDGLILFEEF
jgi:hypothetical protein